MTIVVRPLLMGVTLCITALGTGVAREIGNLQKLQQLTTTGTPVSALAPVSQSGPKADAIRKTLARITLPPGFEISLYALVPGARSIAVGPRGAVTFVSTRSENIYALRDGGHAGAAVEVNSFAPGIPKKIPNGICFSKDGIMYGVEQNRVLAYPAAESHVDTPDVPAAIVVPQGELIPPQFESANHSARYCRIGPDGKLYIAIGEPFNVPPPAIWPKMRAAGLGAIIRMNTDGTGREIYASGIRNSVGLDFSPSDQTLWFTDNQVDRMGDDIPPGELNHATRAGEDFGFPYYGGGHTRTKEYASMTPPADVVFPVVEEVAHAADLGMSFYTGSMFPPEYRGAIFSVQHGSWNRTTPVGARVMVTTIHADGTARTKPFAEGWLDKSGRYLGRPVDVQQLRDGSLLVSDDFAGAVYRITYGRS